MALPVWLIVRRTNLSAADLSPELPCLRGIYSHVTDPRAGRPLPESDA